MQFVIPLALILLAIGIVAAVYYNKMVASRNYMTEAWSSIDVFLKKRSNLIPALVETVKGYAAHEKKLLEELTALRSKALNANSPEEKIASEKMLGSSLGNILVLSENYPDLKANTNFQELQRQLFSIETDIESARRYYNGTVRNNNNLVESFPGNIFAGMFHFSKGLFFEIDESEKQMPVFSFDK